MQSRPIQLLAAFIGLLASAVLAAADARAGLLLIRNARLVDGTGAPPRTGVGILVRDAQSIGYHPDRLDDPLIRRTVPALERATVGLVVVGLIALGA